MTRRPVSPPVRALAAACYLFPVAAALLALPAYRHVRLIRMHALVSLLLTAAVVLVVVVLGRITIFALALWVGLLLIVTISGYFALASWGALCAYQGREPQIPLLARIARRWEKRLGQRRPR